MGACCNEPHVNGAAQHACKVCSHLTCAGHCAAHAAMPPGMYRTAQPYRTLLVLGSAALLAPSLIDSLWLLQNSLSIQTLQVQTKIFLQLDALLETESMVVETNILEGAQQNPKVDFVDVNKQLTTIANPLEWVLSTPAKLQTPSEAADLASPLKLKLSPCKKLVDAQD